MSKATLSYMLDQLEESGFIERIPSINDKRTIDIKLTKLNDDLKEKYIQISNNMNQIFFNSFKETEIDEFEEYLKRILNNLTDFRDKK